MRYWLMKSEPDVFSIDDLRAAEGKRTFWDGVRNYQARNWMRDEMSVGDLVLFYHSNTKVPGVVGLAVVDRSAAPDPTQFDPHSEYFDPTSPREDPRWVAVTVKFKEKFRDVVPLDAIRRRADDLGDFPLIRKANRLSVMPVTPAQFDIIMSMR
jgi:predicted RNA-binding protein with PUA-like domain